jgi:hypothetical protein
VLCTLIYCIQIQDFGAQHPANYSYIFLYKLVLTVHFAACTVRHMLLRYDKWQTQQLTDAHAATVERERELEAWAQRLHEQSREQMTVQQELQDAQDWLQQEDRRIARKEKQVVFFGIMHTAVVLPTATESGSECYGDQAVCISSC